MGRDRGRPRPNTSLFIRNIADDINPGKYFAVQI